MTQPVTLSMRDDVAIITVDNPPVNALSPGPSCRVPNLRVPDERQNLVLNRVVALVGAALAVALTESKIAHLLDYL